MIYSDKSIFVAVKPAGVLSTDEGGGMPSLVREALGDSHANVRTVHRLDRVVSGLMVFARSAKAASELSRQIRENEFDKCYIAVVHGEVPESGEMRDLLLRSKAERKTYVVQDPGKDVQEAILEYRCLACIDGLSLVRIHLVTGRTHQIRCQFSSRGFPIVGDKKYSVLNEDCDIALWSAYLSFYHPYTGEKLIFEKSPPDIYPWNSFDI